MTHPERAVSEIVSLMLIAFLVIVVALFITMALTGILDRMLQEPALLAVTAAPYETTAGSHIIRLHHEQGHIVIVKDTAHHIGDFIIEIAIVDPSGTTYHPTAGGTMSADESWNPGDSLYIYPDGAGGYAFTDVAPTTGNIPGPDKYTITVVDTGANVLIHSLDVQMP